MKDTIERLGHGRNAPQFYCLGRGDGYGFGYTNGLRSSFRTLGCGYGHSDGSGFGNGNGFASGFALIVCFDPLWLICAENNGNKEVL